MVRPFPIEIALHFSKRDDDAKRDDERVWCAKRSGVCPRILCLLEERDDESIDSFLLLSSSV